MGAAHFDILITALLVTLACAVPGVFLVLRKTAMLSDAISHSVLFGIVLAFLVVKDLTHPALVFGAAATGLLTVLLVEVLKGTRRVHGDTAIGLVFPLLFSIAVILISRHAGNVHLDTDSVLSGEIAFVAFNRFVVSGIDLGPKAAWVLGGVLLFNSLFVAVFYKELKLATFDPGLAGAQGFKPRMLHYALMGLVSLTVVAAFEVVGSLLVIALLIVPAATAYLLTRRLLHMLFLAAGVGMVASTVGFFGAMELDLSISGGMVVGTGLVFGLALLFAPEQGMVARMRLRRRQVANFAGELLAAHLLNHESEHRPSERCSPALLARDMNWPTRETTRACRNLIQRNLAREEDGQLHLTDLGRERVRESMTR